MADEMHEEKAYDRPFVFLSAFFNLVLY